MDIPRRSRDFGKKQFVIVLSLTLVSCSESSHSSFLMIRGIVHAQSRAVDAHSYDASTDATPPLERLVSISAEQTPIKDALTEVCRQANVSLQLDAPALAAIRFDAERHVNVDIRDESLREALRCLLDRNQNPGLYTEFGSGNLFLTTEVARVDKARENLPRWLWKVDERGRAASADKDGNIVRVNLGSKATDDVLKKLRTLPMLRELRICRSAAITPKGLAHLADLSALEKLHLVELDRGRDGLTDVALDSVRGVNTLRELTLNESGVTDAGAMHLEDMTQLTRLTLRQEGRLTDQALVSIAKLKQLNYLDLSSYVGTTDYGRMRFSDEGVRELATLDKLEFLELTGHAFPVDVFELPQLRSLSLGGVQIDDLAADWIAHCQEMTSLSLCYTRVSDEGLKQIATLLKLRKFNLDSHFITDMGIGHLTRLPHLQHIDLRASHVSDATLKHLSEIKTLARIDLSGSGNPGVSMGRNFTEAGYVRLANLPNLQTLWLNNADVRWTELTELVQLRVLHLMMPTMSHDDVRSLQEALPYTYVSATWGGSSIAPDGRRGP